MVWPRPRLRRTRRLHAEASRRLEAEEALKHGQRLEALGQLTGGVAHDFNNLLTVIRASVDLLRRPHLSEERRLRYIDAISDTVGRAAKLTAQLLAFARRQTLKPELFEVGQCVKTLSEMIGTLTGTPIEIITRLPEEPCFINADAGQFETALINMAVNARDAMGGEGRLTITVRAVAELPGPAAQPGSPHGYVAVSVEDTGVGIPQERFGRIFEPFFTTKEVGSGSGLGLAQAHGFAKASGGAVRIASTPGRGTLVSLFLPRTLKSPAYVPELLPQARDDRPGAGAQVLVVEDDDEVAALTVEMINQLGYDTTRVASAEAALGALADRRCVDIVFSDVMMPGRMNGVELAQEIRRRRPNLPVLLTSGYAESARRKAGGQQVKIIPKPYRIDELRDALAAVRQDAGRSIREH